MENKKRIIYLVRHGELFQQEGGHRCIGRTDLPLSERGQRQAAKTAQWLKSQPVQRIYSSPLIRCVQTAEIIRKAHDSCGSDGNSIIESERLQIRIREKLQELDAGAWENLTFTEIRERFPEGYEARGRCVGAYAPPGGESFMSSGERFGKCLAEIRKETDENILVVAHAGVMRGYLSTLLNVDPGDIFTKIRMPYAGVTVLIEEFAQESSEEKGLGEADDKKASLRVERVGWRPDWFLDEEEMEHLYKLGQTSERTIRHMKAVAEYIDELKKVSDSECLSDGYQSEDLINWPRLKKAALVHDICRKEKNHAEASARLLDYEGYVEIADLVREHHGGERLWQLIGEKDRISEEEIMFYADKRVREDQVVSLEERFAASEAKCTTQAAKEAHSRQKQAAYAIEKKLRSNGICTGST